MARPIVNLETPEFTDADIVVQYRGVMVRIDRRRILELIELEDSWLRSGAPAALRPDARQPAKGSLGKDAPRTPVKAPSEPVDAGPTPGIASDLAPGPVTHASLSYRLKRIYNHSKASQRLRETHRGLILELIERFDWTIPDHPNSQLDFQLREIMGWLAGSDPHAEARIASFLERYQNARYRSA